ncbi:hypothetical protein [Roseinatronobacter domitianus]|nr:hypothetical protein [Roseibaca domitiana]
MSKIAILAAFGATLVLGACSKHHAAPEPVPAPVVVEPVSLKKY